MEFTAAEDVEITQRWADGESAAAIGKALGRSKNSVVGRKNRLGLESRANPCPTRSYANTVPRVHRLLKVRSEPTLALKFGRATSCCWPIDVPGKRKVRFCEAETNGRGSYCERHHVLAHLRRAA